MLFGKTPLIELAPAAIATCEHCSEDSTVPIPVDGQGFWLLPMKWNCPHCGQPHKVDLQAFAKLLALNWKQA